MPGDVGKTNILYEKLHELFFKEPKSHFEIPSWAETLLKQIIINIKRLLDITDSSFREAWKEKR